MSDEPPLDVGALAALFKDLARSLNQYVGPAPRGETAPRLREAPAGAGDRPGDVYNRRSTWSDVLGPAGWTRLYERSDGSATWQRPGKEGRGVSATTGFCGARAGKDLLYVFSSNAHPLESECCYSKFSAYTFLNHAGDFSAAAKELAEQGYRPDPPVLSASPSANGTVARPLTGVEIILAYFHQRYRPVFKDGPKARCADGATVGVTEACVGADFVLLDRLLEATDAPSFKGGGVNRDALPAFFARWAKSAWSELLRSLPEEDDLGSAQAAPAAEELLRLVRDALLSEVVLGETIAGTGQMRTERRSLIGWCQRFAKMGPWRQIRSKQCWCKLLELPGGEVVLRVAVRHELFFQLVKSDRRLTEMGAKKFTRRAARYGIGTSTEAERPQGHTAVVLADNLVADLLDSLSGEEEEICADP